MLARPQDNLLALGVLFALCLGTATARQDFQDALRPLPGIQYTRPRAQTNKALKPDLKTPVPHYQVLRRQHGSHVNARSAVAVLGAHQRMLGTGTGSYENITSSTAYGTQYAVQMTFGNKPMLVRLDTASSDTWSVPPDFTCRNAFGDVVPQSACHFGPVFAGAFQYGPLNPPEHLYIQYGDGEVISGPMGQTDVTLGNLTVRHQEVALANSTYWVGDNVTNGVLGLAYASLTSAFAGNGDGHNSADQVEYNPLFTNMVKQGLCPPVFGMAIARNANDGMLAFGGVPPVPGLDTSVVASAPIDIVKLVDNPITAYQYSYYTIIPDAVVWNLASDKTQYPCIIDSGTTLNYLPPKIAAAINAAFNPPAQLLPDLGAYFVPCNATAPHFGVTIGGVTLFMNSVDMVYTGVRDPATGWCLTAIADGAAGPYILGDAWLQNVVVVTDVGQAQMHFYPHVYY